MSVPFISSIESLSVGNVTRDITRRGRTALDMGRNVYRAGLGVVATAQSETVAAKDAIVQRYDALVARGTPVDASIEAKTERVVRDAQTTIVSSARALTDRAKRVGFPTRAEVRDLSASVAALSRKVDLLVAKLADAPVIVAEPTVVVLSTEAGWAVEIEGTANAIATYATKDEAVEAARAIATERAPSHLVVYKKDGTIQDKVAYHA